MRALWAAAVLSVGCGSSTPQQLVLTGPERVIVTELGPVPTPDVALDDGTAPEGGAWRSSDEGVATVAGDGRVQAVGPGETEVVATWQDQSVSYVVAVDVPLLLRFVEPPETLAVGDTKGLHVEALLSGENVDPGELAWSSSHPEIATVTATGQATGVAPGVAWVSARAGSAEATLELRVQ
jgi:uncharacterized protein YjdB